MDSSDAGGVAAKHGFLFQDCVAAFTVAEMLFDKKMVSVSFEVVDDIDVDRGQFREFIQVKAAADKSWTPTVVAACEMSSASATKKRRKTIANSSIVHKQMRLATRPIDRCLFRVVTAENPKSGLEYLLAERGKRSHRDEDRSKLTDDLNQKMKDYEAPAGNNVQHWVDSTWWQVFHTIIEIELRALRLIRRAASEIAGVSLGDDRHVEAIWRDILFTVTKRGAASRKISCADDKTYFRSELQAWFRGEVEHYEAGSHERIKIYVRRRPNPILQLLRDLPSPTGDITRSGKLLHQSFELGQYRYCYIAESFCEWLEEVLLLPKEMADLSSVELKKKYGVLLKRLDRHREDMEDLIGRVLLHAAIRHEHQSQPIPASLYTDHPDGLKLLENVHIIINQSSPDELWAGISHMLGPCPSLSEIICILRNDLYRHILHHVDATRKRLLHVKQDSYLLAHDVNEILEGPKSFTQHGSRFQFKIFFGYETTVDSDPDSIDYEEDLIAEATTLLEGFCDDVADKHMHSLHIGVYLYPVPSVEVLAQSIREKLNEHP